MPSAAGGVINRSVGHSAYYPPFRSLLPQISFRKLLFAFRISANYQHPSVAAASQDLLSAWQWRRGRMSAARRQRALSVFLELKVANFALLLSVRRTENKINDSQIRNPLFTRSLFIVTWNMHTWRNNANQYKSRHSSRQIIPANSHSVNFELIS